MTTASARLHQHVSRRRFLLSVDNCLTTKWTRTQLSSARCTKTPEHTRFLLQNWKILVKSCIGISKVR